MATLKSLAETRRPYKKILVFGGQGTGKTKLVGGLAEKLKLKWLDGESGWETLLQLPEEWQQNIELFHIPDDPKTPMFAETVAKVVTGAPCWIDEETGKVNHPLREKQNRPATLLEMRNAGPDTALVIDGLSQLDTSIRNNMTRNKPDDYKFEWDDWGNLGMVLTKILSYIQNAPFHVIVIGHDGIVMQDDKSELLAPTAGTRNFSKNLGKFFGDIVYTDLENKRYKAASSAMYSNKVVAKSRADIAIEKSGEPRLLDLFGL